MWAEERLRSVMARRQSLEQANGAGGLQGVLPRVVRRNGEVGQWNQAKIEWAVRKAFLSQNLDAEPAPAIAGAVTTTVLKKGTEFIDIEDVQNLVEEELMRAGHYPVARAYIIYRAARAETRRRDEEERKKFGVASAPVIFLVHKPDGSVVEWAGADLKLRMEYAMTGLSLCMTGPEIEEELRRSLHSEMREEDLKKTIILNAKGLMQYDADFAKFAGRILLTYIYEEVLGWDITLHGTRRLKQFHKNAFKRLLETGVRLERLHPNLLELDLTKLSSALDPSADLEFDYSGISTLYDRYLIIDKKTSKVARRLETPQLFWMRVAMGMFAHEENPTERILELYRLYKSRRFCSSTPTLFNSGTLRSQLSSCYLYYISDTIESILGRGIFDNGLLAKWAGGLGGSWTQVRGTGSYIKGTNGESQGVIPFLKVHSDGLLAINPSQHGSGGLAADTLIYTARGVVQLDQVSAGDEVLGWTGDFVRVSSLHCEKNSGQRIISVRLKHSADPLRLTGEQLVHAVQGVRKPQSIQRTLKQLENET